MCSSLNPNFINQLKNFIKRVESHYRSQDDEHDINFNNVYNDIKNKKELSDSDIFNILKTSSKLDPKRKIDCDVTLRSEYNYARINWVDAGRLPSLEVYVKLEFTWE